VVGRPIAERSQGPCDRAGTANPLERSSGCSACLGVFGWPRTQAMLTSALVGLPSAGAEGCDQARKPDLQLGTDF